MTPWMNYSHSYLVRDELLELGCIEQRQMGLMGVIQLVDPRHAGCDGFRELGIPHRGQLHVVGYHQGYSARVVHTCIHACIDGWIKQ